MKLSYWHQEPGHFLNMKTGQLFDDDALAFVGSRQEWNETLVETLQLVCESLIQPPSLNPKIAYFIGTSDYTRSLLKTTACYVPAPHISIRAGSWGMSIARLKNNMHIFELDENQIGKHEILIRVPVANNKFACGQLSVICPPALSAAS